jgi:GntR family transcriptional regulator / MocR family aminotransferase
MSRQRVLLDWLTLESGANVPLYRQVYEQIRGRILSGHISAGAYLPASRSLADDLALSRITVLRAYDQLVAEGFLEARVGSGVRVVSLAEDVVLRARTAGASWEHDLDHALDAPRVEDGEVPANAFRPGVPDFDGFPRIVWSRLLGRHGARGDRYFLDYCHPGGYAPLRRALARYLIASRGVACTPDQIVIVSSARAAVGVLCSVLFEAGTEAILEDPGYYTGRQCLQSAGMRVLPIPVDHEGLRTDDLDGRTGMARLAYVTPAHQWPTGATLSLPRRLALLEWARRRDAWIVEDDYDSEFRYSSRPLTALHGLAGGDRVLYLGTFAKTVAPSIQCAYLVVPSDRAKEFAERAFYRGSEPGLHLQAALADFIAEGHFVRHIQRMRRIYRRRRDHLAASLTMAFGERVRLGPSHGGLQMVAEFSADMSAAEAARRGPAHDLCLRDMAGYYTEARPANALHLGFAAVPEREIQAAVSRLAAALAHTG